MIRYRYRARTAEGAAVHGTLEAESVRAVVTSLRSRALFVTSVIESHSFRGRIAHAFVVQSGGRLARLAFFRSLGTLLRAGVSIRRALAITIERCDDRQLSESLRGVLADVEHGFSLSHALGRRPREFSPLVVAMIRAGEAGGVLDDVVGRIATYLERDRAFRTRLRAALAYPALVTVAALGLIAFLLLHVVPMFAGLYASFRVALPPSTKLLLDLGDAVRRPVVWLALASSTALIAAGFVLALRSDRLRPQLSRLRLRIPLAGPILAKAIAARIARTLAILLHSGVGVLDAFEVTAPVAGSVAHEIALRHVREALRAGEAIAEPLEREAIFDPLFVALVRVGEETGRIDDMLATVAEYFELDVESALAALAASLEPLLLLVLGVIVALVVFSIFLPLYNLIGALG